MSRADELLCKAGSVACVHVCRRCVKNGQEPGCGRAWTPSRGLAGRTVAAGPGGPGPRLEPGDLPVTCESLAGSRPLLGIPMACGFPGTVRAPRLQCQSWGHIGCPLPLWDISFGPSASGCGASGCQVWADSFRPSASAVRLQATSFRPPAWGPALTRPCAQAHM